MVPDSHRLPFLELQRALQDVKQAVAAAPGSVLEPSWITVQRIFQEQILPLDVAPLDLTMAGKVQSFTIEINKQLRLLSMDVMFLKTARQSVTAEQRRQQMGDRLELLMRYCEALLEEPTP